MYLPHSNIFKSTYVFYLLLIVSLPESSHQEQINPCFIYMFQNPKTVSGTKPRAFSQVCLLKIFKDNCLTLQLSEAVNNSWSKQQMDHKD
jgi:hypothetical protein